MGFHGDTRNKVVNYLLNGRVHPLNQWGASSVLHDTGMYYGGMQVSFEFPFSHLPEQHEHISLEGGVCVFYL